MTHPSPLGSVTSRAADNIRRPCSTCPWRTDAPLGYWDPTHFREIWQHCQDDGTHQMACHAGARRRTFLPCQG